jgi:hypothetical protein
MIVSPSKIRDLALAVSKEARQGKFTRVSKDFLDRIEAKTYALVVAEVKAHPSVGKTLF